MPDPCPCDVAHHDRYAGARGTGPAGHPRRKRNKRHESRTVSPQSHPVFGRGSGFKVLGNVDYRLARNVIVNEYHKGHLSRLDVCDAHPELLRASSDAGRRLDEECPICVEAHLVLVSYVFGPRLPPSGRCVANKRELSKLAGGGADLAGYVIEVCANCGWNHLDQAYSLSPRTTNRPQAKSAPGAGKARSASTKPGGSQTSELSSGMGAGPEGQ